jgi:Na+-transporting methylmalonyl-CoA/oxaloacetate decarboxylase beta subunit
MSVVIVVSFLGLIDGLPLLKVDMYVRMELWDNPRLLAPLCVAAYFLVGLMEPPAPPTVRLLIAPERAVRFGLKIEVH